jgi:hypothetical protein
LFNRGFAGGDFALFSCYHVYFHAVSIVTVCSDD